MRLIVQSLKQAKEKQRTIPVTFLKVFITGSAASGKTSFSHLLLKEKIREKHESTDLVSASHVVSLQKAAFHDASTTENNEVKWVRLDSRLEKHFLGSLLVPSDSSDVLSTNIDQKDAVTEESNGTGNEDRNSTFLQKSINFFWYLFAWLTLFMPSWYPKLNTSHSTEPSTLKDGQSKVTTTTIMTSDDKEVVPINSEKLKSVKDILQDSLISDSDPFVYLPGRKLNIITILDTGGQPQYIHLLPTINIHPTINFVIHDLSKDLKHQVQVEYTKNGEQVVFAYPLKYSYLDMIKLLMSAANDAVDKDDSYAHKLNLHTEKGCNNDSFLCLVGTHKDQVSDKGAKTTAATLTSLVKTMECKSSVWQNEDKTVLFAVDNTTAGTNKEDPIASIIRSKIERIAANREEYELPMTWMLLQLEIQEVCDQNNTAYISFDQCLKLAKDSGLMSSDEEVKNALKYYHLLGVLLYFADVEGLCDYVITDHQWWFNKLSEIICLALQENLDYRSLNKLRLQGILSKKLLNYVKWEGEIKKEYFLSLLYHMKIIARWKEDYFIPFVLPTCNPQESEAISQYGDIQAKPLLIQFLSGVLPRGFFCSLIVHLLQAPPNGWQPHFSKTTEEEYHAFSNLITFSLPNAYSLSMFDKVSYLEVQIRHKEKKFRNVVCSDAFQNLIRVLKEVCEHLEFKCERLQYGFLCSCNKDIGDHVAFLQNLTVSEEYAQCTVDSTYSMKMTPSHMAWFSQSVFPDSSGMCIALLHSHTISILLFNNVFVGYFDLIHISSIVECICM